MCKPISNRPVPIAIQPLQSEVSLPNKALSSPRQSKKRVSFHKTVDVCVVDRMDAFAVRELFYRPEDFRVFRAEYCQEILERQARPLPLTSVLHAVLSSLTGNTFQIQLYSKQNLRRCHARRHPLQQRASPETLLKELAFII